jgi:hypothetical protein
MSIDVGNAKGLLKDFKRWEKRERRSYALIVERRNLKKSFLIFLRRDQNHPLLVVLRVAQQGLLEADEDRWFTG